MTKEPAERVRNRLLNRLQSSDYERLAPHLKPVDLQSNQVLYEARSAIAFVYFPYNCVLSAVTMMEDGTGIEVGTIGNEGAAGLPSFLGPAVSPTRLLVQVPGEGVRLEAGILAEHAQENRALHDLLLRHHYAFLSQVTQSVAYNGVHPLIKRCCRWLLMTHDRVEGDVLPLTHEFLSFMLAVRRPGVTESLQTLQNQGLIQNGRAEIKITNRAGLEAASRECYGVVVKEYNRLLGSDEHVDDQAGANSSCAGA